MEIGNAIIFKPSGVDTGLIGEYLFSNNSNDTSGFGKNATLRASSTYTTDRNGTANSALNKIADVNDSSAFSFCDENGDLPFTIDFWVYLVNKSNQIFIAKRNINISGQNEYQFGFWENRVVFQLLDNSGTASVIYISTATDNIPLNAWVKLTASYDGGGVASGLTIKVNDSEQTKTATSVGTYTKMATTAAKLTFGAFSTVFGLPIQGYIDDVKIYNKVI